jgi:aspartyl-tRNA(Asn)/glutamyl-tRNA(Gln) amidotransferase subunit B
MLSTGARLSAQWQLRSFKNVINYDLTRWRLPIATSYRSLTTTSSDGVVPLRKQLKDEAKKRKSFGKATNTQPPIQSNDAWELTVGIEIHAELNTACKLFSNAPTSVNGQPNTSVALFDLAYPGSQPHFQHATVLPALRAAIALNCNIQRKSCFDRKHYFYQDQPAGYQITQYYGNTSVNSKRGPDD